jgi:hypothetical protein
MKFPKMFALVKFRVGNTITRRVITQSPFLERTFLHMYHVWKEINVPIFFRYLSTLVCYSGPEQKSYFQEFNF